MSEKQSFEKAFERLEKILKTLNEGEVTLDNSLKLFEEADELINQCSGKLNDAEQKIEKLLKNRNNNIAVDESSSPIKEPFTSNRSNVLNENDEISSPF